MKADSVTKNYLSNTTIFADIFNSYIYGGEQVIRPEQLVEQDTTKIALPYGKNGKLNPVQKQRDVQKLYTAMTDGTVSYVLYGIESQSEIHYAAPIKNTLYDVIDYSKQVEEAARSRKMAKKQGEEEEKKETKSLNISGGEFLSGFSREDRLVPVITVMIYFGAEEWNGPLSLFDMLDIRDKRILPFLDNYRVRLIAPLQMTDEEIMKFQSNMREVLFFIKYSKDKQKLAELLEKNKARFQAIERRAMDVIQSVTNAGLKYSRRKERIDMCQALQEMIMDARAKDQKELQETREELQKARAEVEAVRKGAVEAERKAEVEAERRVAEAERKARMDGHKEIARTMYQSGLDVERIAKYMKQDAVVIQVWVEGK